MQGVLILAAGLAVSMPARADTPPSGVEQGGADRQTQPIYSSIWKIGENGAIANLQSGLVCDAGVDQFHRFNVIAFKLDGLDVGCNYENAAKDLSITEYLTQRGAETLVDDLAEARSELLHRFNDLSLLPDSNSKDFVPNASWLKEVYVRADGAVREGIWLSDLSGWTLEYRVTYRPSSEAVAFSTLAALTAGAQASAGAHLARCARSEIPKRDGVAVGDDQIAMAVAFTASAMVGPIPGPTGGLAPKPAAAPVEWCVEGKVTAGEDSVLLWHGLDASGATADADRVSLIAAGEGAPVLDSSADPEFNEIQSELKRTDLPIFGVTTANGDDLYILGFYAHRPDGQTLARLMSDFVHHRARISASYNPKTKKITVATP